MRKRSCNRTRANIFKQSCNRRGMTEPRAMINIIGSKASAYQLLHQICFFIRAFSRAEARQCRSAVALFDIHKPFCSFLQRFLPACRAEMGKGGGRVKRKRGVLWNIFPPDKGLGQTFWIMDVIKAIAAFHTEPAVICRPASAIYGNNFIVFNIESQLATYPAIGTNRINLFIWGNG